MRLVHNFSESNLYPWTVHPGISFVSPSKVHQTFVSDYLLVDATPSNSPVVVPLSALPRDGGVSGFLPLQGIVSPSKLFSVSVIDCCDRTLCFGMIGTGSAFCIKKGCSVKSHLSAKLPLAGQSGVFVFICRNIPGTVFSEPYLLVERISVNVRTDWENLQLPLMEWSLKFQAVDCSNDTMA